MGLQQKPYFLFANLRDSPIHNHCHLQPWGQPAELPASSVHGTWSSAAWILLKDIKEGVQEGVWVHLWSRGLSSCVWNVTLRTGLRVGSSAQCTVLLFHFALWLTPAFLCLTPTYLILPDSPAVSLSDAMSWTLASHPGVERSWDRACLLSHLQKEPWDSCIFPYTHSWLSSPSVGKFADMPSN